MVGLTKRCQYAWRALQVLARYHGQMPIPAPQISIEAGAPAEFLQEILHSLSKAGLVETRRGAKGGYTLNSHPESVTMGTVIRIIDGPLVTLRCAKSAIDPVCADCRDGPECQTRRVMRDVDKALSAILDDTTLAGASAGNSIRVQRAVQG